MADAHRWELQDLGANQTSGDEFPPLDQLKRMVHEFHQLYLPHGQSTTGLVQWMYDKFFHLPANESLSWDSVQMHTQLETYRIGRIRQALAQYKITSGEVVDRLNAVSRVVYAIPDFAKALALMKLRMSPNSYVDHGTLPPDMPVPAANDEEETVDNFDPNKNNDWQNCFFLLRDALQGCDYRRADGKFFKRVETESGFRTLAFREEMTIEQFISMHTDHTVSFKAFRWLTKSHSHFAHMVEHLKKRALPEAPDLKENCRYRSYEGDVQGRGAGVYDCRQDFFWPYSMMAQWEQIAEDFTQARQLILGASYRLEPPSPLDVCVVHLSCSFPYDMMQETYEWSTLEEFEWYEADAFECTCAADELVCPALGQALHEALPPGTPCEPEVWGRSWVLAADVLELSSLEWECVNEDHRFRFLKAELENKLREEGLYMVDPELLVGFDKENNVLPEATIGEHHYVTLADGNDWIPCVSPARRRRVRPTMPEGAPVPSYRSFVKYAVDGGGTRYFRTSTDRTWRDCETPELDHIFHCQRFVDYDKFYCYASLGRLFFKVKELDPHEFTLFFEGVGGCGKSTLVKAMQSFWPPHLQGILSPNVQPQFGMSAVARDGESRVIFCNEVNEKLQIVQEEWQTSVSGEWGSYAVKHSQAPLVFAWIAQHFWVGNGFPELFNNQQGQVSRRLMGAMMPYPVHPRDGNILKHVRQKLACLQRKTTLAYHEFRYVTGTTDPMSEPSKLPPAFAEYYEHGLKRTNPMQGFLQSNTYVTRDESGEMTLQAFKDLYNKYLEDNDLPRTRWKESVYRTPFNEFGITLRRDEQYTIDGQAHTNVEILSCVRATHAPTWPGA